LNTPAPIVDIRNLKYAVGGRPIFTDLNMQFQRGKVTAVMGPSGTGGAWACCFKTARCSPT
jgi:ABC-type transporter Mla maintaining outer membrane lipid asymmetry ATPase subunit MlaF